MSINGMILLSLIKEVNKEFKQIWQFLSKEGFLIGKVISVNELSAKVKLIKNQDFGSKVSAIIDGKEDSIGTVEGYDYIEDELVMTQVSKDVAVEEGDAVITSGLGVFIRVLY